GRIEIRARRQGDMLHLEVRDDGPGLPPEKHAALTKGIGVANTRARLRQLYGAAHRFEMGNGSHKGLVVTVTIPFREGPENGDAHHAEVNGEYSHPDRR